MTKSRLRCVPFAVACVASSLFLLVRSADAFVARITPAPHLPDATFRSSPTTTLLKAATATAQDEELLHRALLDRRLAGKDTASSNEAKAKASTGGDANRKGDDAAAYVGNLPYSATEAQIRELFEAYGTVKRIYMPTDKETGLGRGFAFVTLGSREEMLAATKALDQSSFLGRRIYSNESVPKGGPLTSSKVNVVESKLYVSNISFQTTKEGLRTHFGQWGTVLDVYIPVDRDTGNIKGFAFVKLAKEDAKQALEDGNGSELDGRTLFVSIPLPEDKNHPGVKGKVSSMGYDFVTCAINTSFALSINCPFLTYIFFLPLMEKRNNKAIVGNLSFDEDTESVRSLFSQYGDVLDCYMPLDKETGRSRGFAFVSLEADAAMRAADETDGYEWNGRILTVNEAQPK
eukprot:CAMPEP_0181042708 /NCGR_PEP_ID=MMETSP1070-20121207/12301_1 /TAXON_ID=265543 /ORGANISM="Minutocellus polymorphus, Strain NH13" /LENGTH=403 /DNA_ID=CAMNT_0023120953 /DNA_START=4 /DNA_END=1217 /DNA_ORIENTATION=+